MKNQKNPGEALTFSGDFIFPDILNFSRHPEFFLSF